MTIKKLEKLERANDRLRKTVDYMQDALATLERKVRELKARPITVPTASLRVVEKAHDDWSAQPDTLANMNGHDVDMGAFARDVRKFAGA